MVRFDHRNVIVGKAVHDLCQIAIDGREDGHAQREVGSPEESVSLFGAGAAHIGFVLRAPTCRAAHHFHPLCPGAEVVGIGRCGGGELDGAIGRTKGIAFKILRVIDIDDGNDFVTAAACDLFNHFAHLAVADKCKFHIFCGGLWGRERWKKGIFRLSARCLRWIVWAKLRLIWQRSKGLSNFVCESADLSGLNLANRGFYGNFAQNKNVKKTE